MPEMMEFPILWLLKPVRYSVGANLKIPGHSAAATRIYKIKSFTESSAIPCLTLKYFLNYCKNGTEA